MIELIQGHYIKLITKRLNCNGRYGLKVMKAFYGHVSRLRVTEDYTSDEIFEDMWIRRNVNGDIFPKELSFVRRY